MVFLKVTVLHYGVILLLIIHCTLVLPLCVEFFVGSIYSWLLSFHCDIAVCVLSLFLAMPWVCLWSVIVLLADHTYFLVDFIMRRRICHP